MNRFLFSIITFAAAVSVTLAADWTQIKQTKSGYQLGTSTNQLVGFLGATPIVTPSAPAAQTNTFAGTTVNGYTLTPGVSAVTFGLALTTQAVTNVVDSVTNIFTVVTGATLTLTNGAVTTSLAATSTNTIYGFETAAKGSNTTTALNALRTILINFGLAK